MSIVYDFAPPRRTGRAVSAPTSSLLNRIEKPALADRLSQDDTSTRASASYANLIALYFHCSDLLNLDAFHLEVKAQVLSAQSVAVAVVYALRRAHRSNRSNPRPLRIWTRSWICSWAMDPKTARRRQLRPPSQVMLTWPKPIKPVSLHTLCRCLLLFSC